MKPATGQILRRVGLLIETICLLGLLSVNRQQAQQQGPPQSIAGIEVYRLLQAGLGLGIILWFTGTWAILRKRKTDPAG